MTIKKAAAIGGGVIGGGWIARLALNGIDVAVYDPHPEAKRKVDEVMKNARRAYRRMATKGLPKEGKVTFEFEPRAAKVPARKTAAKKTAKE